jgi:hypothetical protein
VTSRPLYVYAVLSARPPGRWRGLAGEPLRFLRMAGLVLAAGTISEAPAPTTAALRRHDRVAQDLGRAGAAVLPMRFGTIAADRADLGRLLAPQAPGLRRALAEVKGRAQMTVRVFGARGRRVTAVRTAAGAGPGARYLAARHPARIREMPDVARLRAALAGIVRAERIEGSQSPPLVASLYHLVDRAQIAAYRRAFRSAACHLADVRVTQSGPWAAYAFAPRPGDPDDGGS